jgi:hypothetical protein
MMQSQPQGGGNGLSWIRIDTTSEFENSQLRPTGGKEQRGTFDL